MIARLQLENFTAFKNLTIDFSPGINVIIGENSTGKTHLLKAAYALCKNNSWGKSPGAAKFLEKNDHDKTLYPVVLTAAFVDLFKPIDDELGRLHKLEAKDAAKLSASFGVVNIDKNYSIISFTNNSKEISFSGALQDNIELLPTFIPTKEVLSFMLGFSSLYQKYELSFDQTYQDICSWLELPPLRAENLSEKSKLAKEKIENICGGKFVFLGGGEVIFKQGEAEYSANAVAEGFRKIGVLARLLETGAISPGYGGPLLWDEPEANLNPKLLKVLVEILLELARQGQQIILTTHDYVLLKWFDLLMDKEKGDQVRFHNLYRNDGEIKVDSFDNYLDIKQNAIDEAFDSIVAYEIAREMGNLGK